MVAISSMTTAINRSGGVVRAGLHAVAWIGGLPAAVLPHTATEGPAHVGETASTPALVQSRIAGLPVSMAYERCGAGEPVVLLHGVGLNRHTWDTIIPSLAAERDVITIDLPGFGQSPDWPKGLTRDLATMVKILNEAFTAFGVDKPHVVGHSLGGLIALRLGQAGLARSVTALAPAGFWNQAERRYAFAVLTAARRISQTMPDPMVERLSATAAGRMILTGMLYGDPGQCPPGAVATCLHALRDAKGFDAVLRAGRAPGLFTGPMPDIPVTIAWGTRDRILLPHQAERATAMLPEAQLVWLPGCGHTPMNDAPEAVTDLILKMTQTPRMNRIAGRNQPKR